MQIVENGEIARRIRTLRIKSGYSQNDLAEIIGLLQPAYSRKETGDIDFTLKEIDLLSEFLKVDIKEIIF